ncbi:delta-lactam-biosynthetic de-N-acetylase [Paenibacillus pinihumi]|uniref:delta-lactam-biosynthetic de-N-acetylase n=1 Tax=Paenibacillus pinihumi TaxID=669462 RepID=UPI00055B1F43|nr:delta-lactam-biosynthetic de-N-acetylase [Paenibacillus pinihumi]
MLLVFILLALYLLPAEAEGASRPFHFGFKRSVNGNPASINEEGFKEILERHGGIFLGNSTEKSLYMTFDNGYENGFTGQILDVLKQKKVPAAFFVTGHYINDQPELLKRMAAEGHIIGNHSWSHPDMTQISTERIHQELDKVKQAVEKVTGKPGMSYLRPPRGIFSEHTLRVSHEMGYTNVFWSIAYKDWDTKQQKGRQYAYNQVMKQLHPGAVLLLHSVSRDNTEALGSIIDAARQQGYDFRSLDDLKPLQPLGSP